MSWELRLRMQRAALAPVLVLAGRWRGRGEAHGEPVVSELVIRPVLDGTMIEARERTGDHEDICFYRWEVERQQIWVLHLMPGAAREYPVEQTADGLIWVTPPEEPAVEWSVRGAGLRQEVIWPEAGAGAGQPEVWIEYARDEDERGAGGSGAG